MSRPGNRLGGWTVLALMCAVTGVSSAGPSSSSSGTITLRAGVLSISAAGIVATGSPVIQSSQGTVAAPQFNVILDRQGRASEATATGGVHFSLVAATGSYRSLIGTCERITLYPATQEAVLSGALTAVMQGPKVAPTRLSGTSAQLFGAMSGRPAHIEVSNARGEIPSHS